MTATATFGDHGAAAALANKKQMAEVIVLRDEAASKMDWVRSLPRKAKAGALSALQALKLDHLGRWIAGTFGGVFHTAKQKVAQGWRLFSKTIGLTNLIGWLLADKPSRDKALEYAGKADAGVRKAGAKARGWIARIPLVGTHLSKAISWIARPVSATRSFVVRQGRKGVAFLDAHDTHGAARWLRSAIRLNVLGRVVRAFVPAQFRMLAYAAGLLFAIEAKAVVNEAEAITKQAVEAGNGVVAVESKIEGAAVVGEVFEVEIVESNTTMMLKVLEASDNPEVKVVVYAGAEYDIKTVGDADTDPIRPTIDQRARTAKALAREVAASKAVPNRADKRAAAKAHGPLAGKK